MELNKTDINKKLESLILKINVAIMISNYQKLTCLIRYKNNDQMEIKKSSIRSFKNNMLELEDLSTIYIKNLIDLHY